MTSLYLPRGTLGQTPGQDSPADTRLQEGRPGRALRLQPAMSSGSLLCSMPGDPQGLAQGLAQLPHLGSRPIGEGTSECQLGPLCEESRWATGPTGVAGPLRWGFLPAWCSQSSQEWGGPGGHGLGVALDSPGQGGWGPHDPQTQRRSHSLVHQVFGALRPVIGDIFKMTEEGRDLLLQVFLRKREHEQLQRLACREPRGALHGWAGVTRA